MSVNSKQKGKRAELQWRDELIKAGFHNSRRGVQYSGSSDSPDVVCEDLPNFHFEVKSVEKLNVWNAMDQAIRDASYEKVPVLAHTKNRRGWLVTLDASDFLYLLHKLKTTEGTQ